MIGGSAGIGLATARQARAEGADVILTARDPERLQRAAGDLGAVGSAAFDAADPAALEQFFADLPAPVDHVLVSAGRPYYAPLAELDFDAGAPVVRRSPVAGLPGRQARPGQGASRRVARCSSAAPVARRPGIGLRRDRGGHRRVCRRSFANLALEVAPIRVNLIAAGLRRHAAVGLAARRPARRAPRAAALHAADRAASSGPTTSPRSPST